jgi:hypothetical protein
MRNDHIKKKSQQRAFVQRDDKERVTLGPPSLSIEADASQYVGIFRRSPTVQLEPSFWDGSQPSRLTSSPTRSHSGCESLG